MIVRIRCLTSYPCARKSSTSQAISGSSLAGLVARRSSSGSIRPRLKKFRQTRLTIARAKYGFSGLASQSANASRRSPRASIGTASASSGWGAMTTPVLGWRISPSASAETTTSPGVPPSLSRTRAKRLATP